MTLLKQMFGRKVIYSDGTEVNEGNIANILQKAMVVHDANRADM